MVGLGPSFPLPLRLVYSVVGLGPFLYAFYKVEPIASILDGWAVGCVGVAICPGLGIAARWVVS